MSKRREHGWLLILLAAMVPSCGPDTNQGVEPSPSQPDVAIQRAFADGDAPELRSLVDAGALPPLEDRIPKDPRVLPVYDEIGTYGGTWRRGYSGISDRWGPTKLVEERAIEFYVDAVGNLEIVPNWVSSFTANVDSTRFSVKIREGLRWSDGQPVTTEDVRFWYEDLFLDGRFTPTPSQKLTVDGSPMQIVITGDLDFDIRFASPYPLFPIIVARGELGAYGLQGTSFVVPSHYLKDFHPRYVSEEDLVRTAAEYGVDSWKDLWHFGPVQAWWLNPDLPVLTAWKIEVPPPASTIVMVRNPYYHAVDPAGNQLPYIDRIEHELFDIQETLGLWIVQGRIDLQSRSVSNAEYTLYKRNEENGNYRVVTWTDGQTVALYPNINATDPNLAKLFGNTQFRQALSVAINRDEINELFFDGLAEPRQASPTSGSPFFSESFEKKWAYYDPAQANLLLDSLGLAQRDEEGYRLLADGRPLALRIAFVQTGVRETPIHSVVRHWRAVGVRSEIVNMSRVDYEEAAARGEVEIAVWNFDRSVIIPADPNRYLGVLADGTWAPLYGRWYSSGGTEGLEPPEDHPIRSVWQAWESAKSADSLEEAYAHLRSMIAVHEEQVWVIGLVGEWPRLHIVSNRMKNFPENLTNDGATRDIGLAQPAQLYIGDEGR